MKDHHSWVLLINFSVYFGLFHQNMLRTKPDTFEKTNCSNHAFLEFDKYKEVRNKFFRYANHDKTRRNGKGSKKAILVIYFRFFTFFPCPNKRQLLFFFQICESNICRHKMKTWLFTQRAFGNTMQSDQFIILYMGF